MKSGDIYKKTWQQLKNHKGLFALLIVLQIIVLIIFVLTTIHFQVQILNHAQEVVTTFQNANLNPDSVQAGTPFLENSYQLFESYNAIKQNIIHMIFALFAVFIVFQAWLWIGSHLLIQKKSVKEMLQMWKRFAINALIIFTPFALLGYILIQSSIFRWELSITAFTNVAYLLTALFILLYFFFITCTAFIDFPFRKRAANVKRVFQRSFKTAIKIAFFNTVLVSIFSGILFYTMYNEPLQNFIFIPTVLVLAIFIYTRTAFCIAVRENKE